MALSFIFGGNTGETPASIKQKRDLIRSLMGASAAPKNVGEGLNALGDGIVANVLDRRANAAETAGQNSANSLFDGLLGGGGGSASPSPTASSIPAPGAQAEISNLSGNDVYNGFIDTAKQGGLTNPYGLAALAATGKAESGYDPAKVNAAWSDPSESGQAGTSGGILSLRNDRLDAMRKFAAANGEDPSNISPQMQAKYFLSEDPSLVQRLNGAKSVDEAQNAMNNAWKFAGYNRPGGEAARRLSYANAFLPQFQGQGQQVASLDPSAGIATPTQAIQANAAPSGYVDPRVSAPNAIQQPQAQQPQAQPATASPFVPQSMTQPANQQASASTPPVQVAGNNVQPSAMPIQAPQTQGVDPRYLRALTNPFLNEGQRSVIQGIVNQQYQQQLQQQKLVQEQQIKQASPEYQLALRKAQWEVDNLGQVSPDTKATIQAQQQNTQSAADNAIRLADHNQELKQGDPLQQANVAHTNAETANLANTNDIKEYQFARNNGYTGSFSQYQLDLKRAGSPRTNIDTGTIPQGYQAVRDANGNVVRYDPIPGGPADTSRKDAAAVDSKNTFTDVINNAANLARDAYDTATIPTTGGIGRIAAQYLPTSNAAEVRRQVGTLKSNATIENLNAMRQQSPTGGALGNVTEGEGAMLSAKAGTLDPDSPHFERDLDDYQRTLLRIVHGKDAGDKVFDESRNQAATPASPAGSPDIQAARDAIARGAPRDKVIQRLQNAGIDTSGL